MQTPLTTLTCAALGSVLCALPAAAQGYAVDELDGRWRVTWEEVDAGDAGRGELLGLHYEVFGLAGTSGLFAGVGAYGAVNGDIGNLFAAGVDLGWRQRLTETFSLQIGTFAGTSGGTITQGEAGFAYRPFVALEADFRRFGLRAEVAQLDVAGADLDEPVFALGVTLPMNWLSAREQSSWASPIDLGAMDWERVSLGAGVLTLDPRGSNQRLDGSSYADDVRLGGLRVGLEVSESTYVPIEAWGAVAGGVGGFRALMAGYGLRGPLWESALPGQLDWEVELMGGVAGGGQVDVGSGLALKALVGLRARLARNWTASVGYAYFDARDGDFTANGLQLGVAWDPRALELGYGYDREALANQQLPASEGMLDVWQFGLTTKAYDMRASAKKQGGGDFDGTQYLVGIGAERHLTESVSILARAFGPVEGDIGGYSEVLGGVRVQGAPFDFMGPFELYAEYDVGAAGGGAVEAGSGLVHQIAGGVAVDLFDGVELGLGIGRMNALDRGSLDASVVELGVAVDVARVLSRR